ncbi:bifunctional diguanylate cyclase/phosphodiesterase [Pseudothauera rhizosphaerae]|uniref:EAL domain-containing protein n=1 Tax=Pseudothauera rhizosphaerae TaxID=2565932 RepID=A0A4S4A8B5_9RHOO|nr:LapD/MoxY N-terminal periplasmic domain-containing protein [Pseudothauera rhizosphaerae]THF54994.1 EAL domain-containing protein [Pseudothauera rhizosphaerae]
MSLIKQLWIAIFVVMTLAFGSSLVVSTLSARHYLSQQVSLKNVDNATSLALALSQMPKDPVTVELQVAAQFDTGHYRLIRLADPHGQVIVERGNDGDAIGAPEWFARLVPIETHPGIAQVQDGWRQYGTLSLESHTRYAYQSLWEGTLLLLVWFVAGAAITGIAGTLLLKYITRPLGRVVEQAEAIGGRRFVTTEEPNTTEFRSVVRAMNALSERVHAMLAEESRRLEQLRRQSQCDELTGLANRTHFLNLLDAALTRDDAESGGTLAIVRLRDLAGINRQLGRQDTDRLLRDIAQALQTLAEAHSGWEAGRLNGSDFTLLAGGAADADAVGAELGAALHPLQDQWQARIAVALPTGLSAYKPSEGRGALLARIDGALAAAEQAGERALQVAPATGEAPVHASLADWRRALDAALVRDGVQLALYPAVATDGSLLHFEAPMRLRLDGEWQRAGYFMPWAARLGMMGRLDAAVVRAALDRIAQEGQPIGINLSPEALCDANFRTELFTILQERPALTARLWIEVPEYGVLRHLAEFRALCLALRPLDCKLGIEHVGHRVDRIGDLHDLGLDYIKVDASMVRGIDTDTGNQNFVRGLCVVAHAIGLVVIAEGVGSDAERNTLATLGLDGATGPGVEWPGKDS